LRVIAGKLKGRRLLAPSGRDVRPTSDRLRETLFNVLAARVDGARVLDGYAGTGALGIEALSRGAASVTFIERDAAAVRLIRDNLTRCGIEKGCVIIRANLTGAGRRLDEGAFDLILLDPPYQGIDPTHVIGASAPWLAPGGWLVLEHSRRTKTPAQAGGLTRVRELVAGDSALAFYERDADAPVPDRPSLQEIE
jgi:16S rRNA (guanine(966)-N(2))-methyltransferase RsmD